MNLPDHNGYFGAFGGRFVPETLMGALNELETSYRKTFSSPAFSDQLNNLLKNYAGRPTPLYRAENLENLCNSGCRIYLKREDLLHTGAHKLNNAVGQVLLAKLSGKKRVIAETGAGQHGVATATACALLGLKCCVYMGSEDVKRQKMNVFRMELLGTEVIPVDTGSCTLKDAINEALRDWVSNVSDTFYCIGSVVGPHPYPVLVRDFQSVIGKETKEQILSAENRLPDEVIACVGGGSNAMGMFHAFVPDTSVKLTGVEAGGKGNRPGQHAATLTEGKIGVLHGAKSYLLYDDDGQILSTHSVSAGLDYPGVGPEHSYLKDIKRAEYLSVTDSEALEAFHILCRTEGIIPALESSHAIAWALKKASSSQKSEIITVCLSGRGDKDLEIVRGIV